jgi:hypothetical protein
MPGTSMGCGGDIKTRDVERRSRQNGQLRLVRSLWIFNWRWSGDLRRELIEIDGNEEN